MFDLVGDSGTVLRQASEGIAQLKNKMGKSIASLVKGSKEIDSSSQESLSSEKNTIEAPDTVGGPVRKDVITAIFSEFRPFWLQSQRIA